METQTWTQFYSDEMREWSGCSSYMNLGEILREATRKFRDHEAFRTILPNGIAGGMTYGELDHYSDHFAVWLREEIGLAQGDVVAIQSPNCLAYPVAAFGIAKAGCVITNMNPLYTEPEMVHQLNDSRARVLVVIDMFADKVDAIIRQTGVEQVVAVSVTDFLPYPKAVLVHSVLKYVKKQIPEMETPHSSIGEAMAAGARLQQLRAIDTTWYYGRVFQHDTALYQYTGGTTGASKGAELTHANMCRQLEQLKLFLDSRINEGQEQVLVALPMYHIFAFSVCSLLFVEKGGCCILVPNPRPLENLKPVFEQTNITWFPGVNTLFNGLLAEDWFRKNPPKNLKLTLSGATALQTAVTEDWHEVTGCPIVEAYGMTETSPGVTFNPVQQPKGGSIGIPLPGTDIRLVNDKGDDVATGEPGELLVRGPQVMKGYLHRPEATAETIINGWLHTGDVAVIDEEGYLRIVDRKKDMAIVSGFNVYPNELEDVIAGLPGVSDVAVIGVPDDVTGEAVKAFVVKSDETLTAEAVTAWCRERLTAYKVPKQIEFRADLPKSPVGKILRKDLKAEEAAKAALTQKAA